MPPNLVRRTCPQRRRRTAANCVAEEKDLLIIGGGVAGYVAAIKAGQAGLKVRKTSSVSELQYLMVKRRSRVLRSVAASAEHASTSAAFPQSLSSTTHIFTTPSSTTPRTAESTLGM